MRGSLALAKSESSEIGSFHQHLAGEPKSPPKANAPPEGSNAAFDEKVRLLRERMMTGDADVVTEIADGSSVPTGADPFDEDVRREMDRLEAEVKREASVAPAHAPPPPVEDTLSKGNAYGDQLRAQMAKDTALRGAADLDRRSSPPPGVATGPTEQRRGPDADYGDRLREQMASDAHMKEYRVREQASMDALAERQEEERRQNMERMNEAQRRREEEKGRKRQARIFEQQRYRQDLDRQAALKENARVQEGIERRQGGGAASSLSMPSEKAQVVSPAARRRALREQQSNSPRRDVTRKGLLEQEYEIAAKLEREMLRDAEDKKRRVEKYSREREAEKRAQGDEKREKQEGYRRMLEGQQLQQQQQRSESEGRNEMDRPQAPPEMQRQQVKQQQRAYAEQLYEQMQQKQRVEEEQVSFGESRSKYNSDLHYVL